MNKTKESLNKWGWRAVGMGALLSIGIMVGGAINSAGQTGKTGPEPAPVQRYYSPPAPVYNPPAEPFIPRNYPITAPSWSDGYEKRQAEQKQQDMERRIEEAEKRACQAQQAAAKTQRQVDGYAYNSYELGCY